jgi:GTPase
MVAIVGEQDAARASTILRARVIGHVDHGSGRVRLLFERTQIAARMHRRN